MQPEVLELRLVRADERLRLLAPTVGELTAVLPAGQVLTPGQDAGWIRVLGRSIRLRVPAGATGLVVSTAPERVHHPVGFGDVVYELDPTGAPAGAESAATPDAVGAEGELVLRATSSGRFYRRPSPADPPFVEAGDALEEGTPVGLIEVMKTFNHVAYRAKGGLPARARVVHWVAEDGGEVRAGDALLAVEPA